MVALVLDVVAESAALDQIVARVAEAAGIAQPDEGLAAKVRLSDRRVGGLSPLGVVRFVPYFLWESLKGGIDVALRVLGPRVRVDPGYLEYRIQLIRPAARVAFMDAVNLLPGTLTADVAGDRLWIHALDRGAEPMQSLVDLEVRVGHLFGERLPSRTPVP
jgi:multicomponent Na+:H+ antiporter subunit E